MLEQAGRLGPSVPIITARVASGSPATTGALSAGGAGWLHAASEAMSRAAKDGAIGCFMGMKLAAAARARNVRRPTPESRIFAWVLRPSTLYNRYDRHARKQRARKRLQTAQRKCLWRRFDQGPQGTRRGAQAPGHVYRRHR